MSGPNEPTPEVIEPGGSSAEFTYYDFFAEPAVVTARTKPKRKPLPGAKGKAAPATPLEYWDEVDDAPWDLIFLGGFTLPGVWCVVSGECARQIDHKKTKGKDGGRIKDMGMLPSRFSLRGQMQSREEWTALQTIIPHIHPKKKGETKSPLGIYHPAIALLGISSVYVERVRVPEIRSGILEMTVDVIEWTPEPKATKAKDVADTAEEAFTKALFMQGLKNQYRFSSNKPTPEALQAQVDDYFKKGSNPQKTAKHIDDYYHAGPDEGSTSAPSETLGTRPLVPLNESPSYIRGTP